MGLLVKMRAGAGALRAARRSATAVLPRLRPRPRLQRRALARARAATALRPAARALSTSPSAELQPWACPAGEGALLLRFGTEIDVGVNARVLACMSALDRALPAGVREVLPAYASLLVHFDPLVVSAAEVEQWCLEAAATASSDPGAAPGRVVEVPVKYGGEHGPDIDEVARLTGLGSADEVARVHSEADYRVYFLGFTGGFPYLGGLSGDLASVPRLDTPRQSVPGGTVGIAAGQTGVYPLSTPGGWHLLGRTGLQLFDAAQDPPAALRAGDTIKFVPSDEAVAQEGDAAAEPAPHTPANPWIEVVSPGPMTTVQDVGRHGYARHGVSRSGAADGLALQMGNALLGNDEGAAGLEVALGGLKLRCAQACAVALTGADCSAKLQQAGKESLLDIRTNEAVMLQPGDELALGFARDGARAYLCVQGGVDVPEVLGSRSTDVRAALGGHQGRILQAGDLVGRMPAAGAKPSALLRSVHDPLRSATAEAAGGKTWTLRMLPGPGNPATSATSADAGDLQALLDGDFSVLPRSDRMAVCLSLDGGDEGTGQSLVGGEQMSEACVSGTIQLPPDGKPLILLAEHQTTGGYKVPGIVIQADLWQVGQMNPGDSLRFVETTAEEATAALNELRQQSRECQPRQLDSAELNLETLTAGTNQMGDGSPWMGSPFADANQPPPKMAPSFALSPRSGAELRQIDLNADVGEGFDDAGLLEYVTSVNIACGAHAGTTESIAKVVEMAAERNAGIGAHVSFVDRENFGRTALDTPPLELRDQVLWQASALDGLCKGVGTRVRYIKPHGALYHAVMSGGEQGEAVLEAAQLLEMPLLLMPRSPWASFGEGFAERAYDGDSLRSRDKPGALIHDPAEAAAQAVALAAQPTLHSICVHGDSPGAVEIAAMVRRRLERAGFTLRPFAPEV